MIDDALFAKIRRLFYAEHWKIGTIVSQLSVHPDAVRRVLGSDAFNRRRTHPPPPSMLEPYKPLIVQTLEQHPRLRATRLFEMVQQRGYPGAYAQVMRYVQTVRPQSRTEAYFRLQTLPGEQAQVDWAHFGTLSVQNAKRPLSCFVMVLSHSRAMYARFFLDQSSASFLLGHVLAFQALGGVPRQILYDNLKAAVLERGSDTLRFHPQLLELCGHYAFEPRACTPARGNEKGKVERTIQYLRHAFFEARRFASLEDLNAQLAAWIEQTAHARPAPSDSERRPVSVLWEAERPRLLPLPLHPFATDLVRPVVSGKTPYVRFDLNDYSIPHALVRKPLTLCASPTEVRITDATGQLVACHSRCWGRAQVLEEPLHLAGLQKTKARARPLAQRLRLVRACSHAESFLQALTAHSVLSNFELGPQIRRLGQLLDSAGPAALNAALKEALDRGALSLGSVEHLLEQRRKRRRQRPPVPLSLPADPRVQDVRILPHDLLAYDALTLTPSQEDDDVSG